MSRINKKHLTSAILLAAFIALLLMQLVRASPISITSISPTSGPVGTVVTVVGEADTPGGLVMIYFDIDGDGLIDYEEFRGSNTASATPPYTFTVPIVVPPSTAGTHAIIANDVDAGKSTGSDFTVTPQITINPTSGPIGTVVTITGTGFGRISAVTITFDAIDVTPSPTPETNEVGSFSASFPVPPTIWGDHIVTATDAAGNTYSTTFTLWRITISIDRISGPVGTIVAVSGIYATPEGHVTIQWDGVDVETVIAGTDGTYSYDLTVPRSTAGAHTITAEDVMSTNTVYVYFTVEPQITLSVNKGPVGTEVRVIGTGFAANAFVDITYDTTLVVHDVGTDSAGSLSLLYLASFNVPASVAGDHTVTVADTVDPTITASATFTVIPEITITPTSGPVGTSATVTGTGFAGGSTVDIYFDRDADGVLEPEDLIFTSYPTDATGGFSTNYFDVPDSVYGSHIVNATDAEGNFYTATFTVNALIILTPEDGLVRDPVVVDGTGFSGVSQVDVYFDIDKDGLPDPEEIVLDNVPTDEFGSFDATFTVPWVSTAGNYLVIATDAKGVSDDATFTVLFVMYTKSNEYFQGDYPSFFIQSFDRDGSPIEGDEIYVEIYDPDEYMQYWGYSYTDWQGIVPYCDQFYTYVNHAIVFSLPSDATVGTWIWMGHTSYYGRWISGSFEVVERVDLRALLEKLDQLLEGQDDIAGMIVYYGEKLHLEHEELAQLIAAVSNKLDMNHKELTDLIKEVSDKLQLQHEDLADLVESVFHNLEIKLDDIKSEIVGIKEKVDGLYLVIGNLEVKLDDINAKLTNIQGRLATIETDIGTIKTDISAINGHLAAIDGRLATIESAVGTIETDISSINGKITSIEGKLATIQTDIGTIKADTSAIKGKLTTIEGNIATITTDIGTIKTNVNNINAKIVAIEGRLATIETDVGTVKVEVTTINAKLTDIQGRLATIETDIGTIKTDISAINGKIVAIEGRLATIETDIGKIKTDITNLGTVSLEEIREDIATIKTDIGTIEVNVNNINANITSIKGRLVTIETNVGTIKSDIDNINGKIVTIEGETATIKTDIGTIKTSLTDINTKIKVTNDNVATIQTDIGTIKGTLTSIQGDVATIKTDIGTVKTSTSSIETTGESIKSDTSLQPATIALSLIAAIAAIAAAAMVLRKVYLK